MSIENKVVTPWFKQPWLWFVLSVPIASVILSSIMVFVAVKGKDSLVSDNYYKDGMAINQTIEQDQLAKSLGLKPILTVSGDGNVILKIQGTPDKPQAFLTLKILHPTVKKKDVIMTLLPSADGFVGELPAPVEGRYYIDLYSFDESWRIREEIILPVDQHVMNRN